MKKSIATAAVCGASLFGFTAVAGAANTNMPNPHDPAVDVVSTGACVVVQTHNATANGTGVPAPFPNGIPNQFDSGQLITAFDCPILPTPPAS